jgi:hypothetical protein
MMRGAVGGERASSPSSSPCPPLQAPEVRKGSRDPVFFRPLDPDLSSGIRFFQIPFFQRTQSSEHFLNSLTVDKNIFSEYLLKKFNNFHFLKVFMVTKKGKTSNLFFPPLFCCCWIRDPGWRKVQIQYKYPGSVILAAGIRIEVVT